MVKSSTRFVLFLFFGLFSFILSGGVSLAQDKKTGTKKTRDVQAVKKAAIPIKPAPAAVTAPQDMIRPEVLFALFQGEKIKTLLDEYQIQNPVFKWAPIPNHPDGYVVIFEKGPEPARGLKAAYPDYQFYNRDQLLRFCENMKCGVDLSFVNDFQY
jgi:hypothetical protein